jgi:L-ascorbate metabolism protein UlaG (beta-lactamase superfamily)
VSLTFLGHSAIHFEVSNLHIFVDPYLRDPVDFNRLPRGHVVLFSHGHFDAGVLLAPKLYENWRCQFVGPKKLITWMRRKFKKTIRPEDLIALDHGESMYFGDVKITAVSAHHPLNRLGKTIMALFARSRAPGKPVNGYHFAGYYHSGATIYTQAIPEALKGVEIHTACIPIGGKYAIASPEEALNLAEQIEARRLVPMHWQPLLDQVFFRYQPSDLIRLARSRASKVTVLPLAIGEHLDRHVDSDKMVSYVAEGREGL